MPYPADDVTEERTACRREDSLARIKIRPLELAPSPECARLSSLGLLGGAPAYLEFAETLLSFSRFDYDVLLVGPSGTGKSVAAEALHRLSRRAAQPFIEVNSAAFQEPLAESLLFGHEKGAFTGAHTDKKGLFEEAHGGTVFFDEIGDMPLHLQAKVLKTLDKKMVTRVGGSRPIQCDVRIIFATWQNLRQLVREKAFREDLFNRINVLQVAVPPLCDRRADIPLLVNHYLAQHQRAYGRERAFVVEPEAMRALEAWDWPGNVRELENLVKRLAVLAGERDLLTLADVTQALAQAENLGLPPVGTREGDLKTIQVSPFRIGDDWSVWKARTLIHIYNTLFMQSQNASRVAHIMGYERSKLYHLLQRAQKAQADAPGALQVLKRADITDIRSVAEEKNADAVA